MAEGAPFSIGAKAWCADAPCGRVSQLVVNPVNQTVTHLVVEPDHREGLGRLVPLTLVEQEAGLVRLQCTPAEFDRLPHAEVTQFLPGSEGYENCSPDQVLLWPYFGGNSTVPEAFDTLPVGEVAVRRGEQVHATDGHLGQVRGLVVDRGSQHVSHVLLEEGHVWGHKEVAIPMSAVAEVSEGRIQLRISKQDVKHLPAVELDRKSG